MNARMRSCRTMVFGLSVLAPLALVPLACTHAAQEMGGPAASDDVITEDAIRRVHAFNAYDAVLKIRANFLSFRGNTTLLGTSQPYPTVYLDNVPYGPMTTLKNIPADQVSTIRLYRAGQATTRFGMGNMGGVIEVVTKH